jgi:hypothetical protein
MAFDRFRIGRQWEYRFVGESLKISCIKSGGNKRQEGRVVHGVHQESFGRHLRLFPTALIRLELPSYANIVSLFLYTNSHANARSNT